MTRHAPDGKADLKSEQLARRILNSWKEIASYMGRGVRTIQRYEMQLGFPVHRPAGKQRSAVLAFTDEIDAWLKQTPTHWRQIVELDGAVRARLEVPLADGGNHHGTTACPLCGGTGRIHDSQTDSANGNAQPASRLSPERKFKGPQLHRA